MIDFTSLGHHFKVEAGKSVNRLLTMRNWLFGYYIVEFQTGRRMGSRFWKNLQ